MGASSPKGEGAGEARPVVDAAAAVALFWRVVPQELWNQAASTMLQAGDDVDAMARAVALVALAMSQAARLMRGVPGAIHSVQRLAPGIGKVAAAARRPREEDVPPLAEIHEVARYGGRESAFRSADQTAAALFWHAPPPGLWAEAVAAAGAMLGRRGGLDVVAQGVSQVAEAMARAAGSAPASRPVPAPESYIRGDIASRIAPGSLDPRWEPLLREGPGPAPPGLACVLAGSAAGALRPLLGDDGDPFVLTRPDLGLTRRFANLSAMLQEIEDAQVWAGLRFRSAAVEATEAGLRLARAP